MSTKEPSRFSPVAQVPQRAVLDGGGGGGGRQLSTYLGKYAGVVGRFHIDIPSSGVLPVLWRRRRIVLGSILFALLAGTAYLLTAAPLYRSSSRIYIQQNEPKLIGDGLAGAAESVNYLLTQCEVMTSTAVLTTALESPEAARARSVVASDNPVAYLKRAVEARVGKQSEIITVSAESPYPEEAAVLVNAVVDAYITYQNKTRRSTAAEVLKILGNEKQQQEEEYKKTSALMLQFKKGNGVWSFGEDKENIVMSRLAELSQALTAAELEAMRFKATVESVEAIKGDPDMVRLFMRRQQQAGKDAVSAGTVAAGEVLQLKLRSAQMRAAYGNRNPIADAQDRQREGLQAALDDVDRQEVNSYVAGLRQQLVAAEHQVAVLQNAVNAQQQLAENLNVKAAEFTELDTNLRRTEKLLDTLDSRIKEINVNGDNDASNSISILEVGKPDYDRVRPARVQVLAGALLIGLMVGLGGALLQDWLDHRVRSADDVASLLDLRVLGIIPRIDGQRTPEECAQETHRNRASEVAEAYRMVRTAVQFADDGSGKTLLVTSPEPGDGKSTVASNLAIAIAQTGRRVLLIDADGRRPKVHRVFAIEQAPGLSDVLMGDTIPDGAIRRTETENLDVLPAGPVMFNPAEMLDAPRFSGVMEELGRLYDRIIIDSPPIVPVTDARILAASCDATLLVLRAEKSTRQMSENARAALASVAARVVGVVINDVPRHHRDANYYGGYGYAAGEGNGNGNGHGRSHGNGNGHSHRVTAVAVTPRS